MHSVHRNSKQKILRSHGPSNINLGASLSAPLMFAGLHNHFALRTIVNGCTISNNQTNAKTFKYLPNVRKQLRAQTLQN